MPGQTILVVEDHEILRAGLQEILEVEGYQVVVAEHGLDALRKMGAVISPGSRRTTGSLGNGVTPHLILSDISMPKMDGYAFFETVRSRPEWVSIPFIFLTARHDRADVFAGKKLGVDDYLIKPVTRQELTSTIRSRLARSYQLLLVQLQEAYDSSLMMLANAIEQRDAYTSGHVERVHEYAQIIAKKMNCSQACLNQVHYGSILHDIGKIHIPKAVLGKPGSLNSEEWEEMKKHPDIGVELIRRVPYLQPAIPVIQSHHERWDGGGYPDSLTGEEIPISARIVTVADSLDAMSYSRAYRRALSPPQAYDQILQGAGTQYDPAVVNAFRLSWEEITQKLSGGDSA